MKMGKNGALIIKSKCRRCRKTIIELQSQCKNKKNLFCSRKCKFAFEIGKNASGWKNGRINNNGYVYIYSPLHPRITKRKYRIHHIGEHIIVMEKYIGRFLKSNEIVHHRNGKRNDNRIQNLVLTTQSNHIAEHNAKRFWKRSSIEKARINATNFPRNENGTWRKMRCEKWEK